MPRQKRGKQYATGKEFETKAGNIRRFKYHGKARMMQGQVKGKWKNFWYSWQHALWVGPNHKKKRSWNWWKMPKTPKKAKRQKSHQAKKGVSKRIYHTRTSQNSPLNKRIHDLISKIGYSNGELERISKIRVNDHNEQDIANEFRYWWGIQTQLLADRDRMIAHAERKKIKPGN